VTGAASRDRSRPDGRLVVEGGEEGRVLRLRLDAPPGNILDRALIGALRRAVGEAAKSPSLRALLISGAGANFSYGASIEEHLPDRVAPFLEEFHALFRDLIALSLPCVAAVRGLCLGGGLELAAFCQRVVAAPDSRFGQPEIELGVFAPVASLVLPWRLRGGASDDLLLTGRRIAAEEARVLGLVDALAADPEEQALAWIRAALLPKSASALRFAVQAARVHFHAAFLAQLDAIERLYLDRLMRTPDASEGVRAFLEKRKPRFGA
jgi:cyclohexa-1,5-dienecarbonyl-CoA hydratase